MFPLSANGGRGLRSLLRSALRSLISLGSFLIERQLQSPPVGSLALVFAPLGSSAFSAFLGPSSRYAMLTLSSYSSFSSATFSDAEARAFGCSCWLGRRLVFSR